MNLRSQHSDKTTIRIVYASKFSIKESLNISRSTNLVLPLIEDSVCRDLWLRHIGEKNLIKIGSAIQRNAGYFSANFNDAISEHLFYGSNLEAVFLRNYERNTLVSKFFQDFIFVMTGKEFIEKTPNLTIVTDKIGIAKELSEFTKWKIHKPLFLDKINEFSLLRLVSKFKRISYLIIWFFGNFLAVQRLANNPTDLIIHSFADAGTRRTNVYEERYFPGLFEVLSSSGYSPSMLISNAGIYPRGLWKHLMRMGLNPTFEFKYLKLLDLLQLLHKNFQFNKYRKLEFRTLGFSFSNVFRQNFEDSQFDLGTFQSLVRMKALDNILSMRAKSEKLIFICEYEGMQFEKAALLVRNKYLNQFKVVGIQHGAIFSNLLCTFPSKWDLANNLLPDKIVCNGKEFLELLNQGNIHSDRLVVGPALRYEFLHQLANQNPDPAGGKIFVPLPLTIHQETKTLNFIEEALGNTEVQVVFKLHPLSNSTDKMKPYISRNSNFELIDLEFKDILENVSIVVSQTTGALLEFALLGFPVIRISNPYEIEFNSIETIKYGVLEVQNSKELHDAVLSTSFKNTSKRTKNQDLNSYFNHLQNFGASIFLPE